MNIEAAIVELLERMKNRTELSSIVPNIYAAQLASWPEACCYKYDNGWKKVNI